jgi:hypothetical protein
MRSFVAILALVVVVSACGDMLEGVGDLSRGVVQGEQTASTTTLPGQLDLRLNPITGAHWINDEIGSVTAGLEIDDLLLAVWLRGQQPDQVDQSVGNQSVQASRREIAEALPGVEFPQLAPDGVSHVSSQLVYDIQTASLGVATAAAFGLWVGEPYTAARSEAQLAVLRVGLKTFDDGSPDNEVFSFSVAGGRELSWVDGGYVYQLFCRTGVLAETCAAMADSTIPLSLLVSLPSPPAG